MPSPTTPTATPRANEVAALIRERRTIHLFQPETPPRALILRALDLARWGPNHRLTEPWRFYLLGPETQKAIVELNAEMVGTERGASAAEAKRERWGAIPGWLLVTALRSDDPVRDREDYAAACCAMQNMQLYLWSEGIGVKWTSGPVTRDDRFWPIVGVDPEAEQFVGLFWYGYPAHVPETPRRSLDEVLAVRA